MEDDRFRFRFHDGAGIRLHTAECGDPGAPLVLCLHGFPEYWAGWAAVMAELGGDFHAVAPDQRGYNLSDKPSGVRAYAAKRLAGDVAALADALSPGKPFVLAGHDWGASVAYAYAFAHPHRVSHLVIANGVHPVCFQRAIVEDPGQRQASQYINRLRAEDAEESLRESDHARLFAMLEKFSAAAWMGEGERKAYRAAWRRQDALTGMLDWYRASPVVVPAPGEPAPDDLPLLQLPAETVTVPMPHLVLWGEDDTALRPSCIEGLEQFAPQLAVRRFVGAGHWILHERPVEVAEAIRAFVAM